MPVFELRGTPWAGVVLRLNLALQIILSFTNFGCAVLAVFFSEGHSSLVPCYLTNRGFPPKYDFSHNCSSLPRLLRPILLCSRLKVQISLLP